MAERTETYYQELQPFVGKIKPLEEIMNLVGNSPRSQKLVMCHGVFDPIHPGHRRLLEYARKLDGLKDSNLVIGVASDQSATQGTIPPYMPQGLRTLNVAALPHVTYVYVSENIAPTADILSLKPDYFVKGYSSNGDSSSTENEAILSYGGEIILAPGDVSYAASFSSEKQIKLTPEELRVLGSLMDAEDVSFDDLRRTIERFPSIKVDVVGDLIIDKYTRCTHLGQNSKGPYPSIKLQRTDMYVGGAGIVAKHLRSLGAQTTFTTVIGTQRNTAEAEFAQKDLEQFGVFVNAVNDHTRPTTVKQQILASNHPVAQIDDLENIVISDDHLRKICHYLTQCSSQAVVCSDFRHGIFDRKSAKVIADSIPANAFRVADSQVASRWGNILDFGNFGLITPNEKEARFALSDQDTPIGPLAQRLHRESQCRFLILKLGADGIMTHQRADKGLRAGFPLPSFVARVADAVGAGDALLATATATLAVSSDKIVQASILGNLGAALECSKLGNIPITAEELFDMIEKLEDQVRQVS